MSAPHARGSAPGKRRNRFCLTELLVALAALLLLVASLLAAGASARGAAGAVTCESHLARMFESMALYRDDHDGCFPIRLGKSGRPTPWFYVLVDAQPAAFTGELWSKVGGRRFWHCPGCPLNDWRDSCAAGAADYGMNSTALLTPGGKKTFRFAESAPRPADKFLLADAPLTNFRPMIHPVKWLSASARHEFGGNYLFFDGHVERLKRKQVQRWPEDDWSKFKGAADQKPWNCDAGAPGRPGQGTSSP